MRRVTYLAGLYGTPRDSVGLLGVLESAISPLSSYLVDSILRLTLSIQFFVAPGRWRWQLRISTARFQLLDKSANYVKVSDERSVSLKINQQNHLYLQPGVPSVKLLLPRVNLPERVNLLYPKHVLVCCNLKQMIIAPCC
jgi:hypothetical protein